jgi:UDP-glucose 6-dehydrogenase
VVKAAHGGANTFLAAAGKGFFLIHIDELVLEGSTANVADQNLHTGCLLSGYINDTHTYVPGPDGKFGYGGKCFPKDVNAFAQMTEGTPLGVLLAPLHELNVHFRGFEEKI